jgi:hypothetical protein
MPTCNFAKNVHHAWSMQSSKKSIDLYHTTTNDLIQKLQPDIDITSWGEVKKWSLQL